MECSVKGSARCRSSLSSVRLDSAARSSVKRPECEVGGVGGRVMSGVESFLEEGREEEV